MVKKWQLFGGLSLILLVLSGCQANTQTSPKRQVYTSVPTLFFHGYGGNAASTDNLVNSAVSAGAGTRTLRATVAANGQVSLTGRWARNAKHPLIQVVFKDSRTRNHNSGPIWIRNVLTTLHRQYGIKKYNVVAHSAGNNNFLNYETRYSQKAGQPQLQKMVNIAAPMNGILGTNDHANQVKVSKTGKPSVEAPNYRSLLANMSHFPKHQVSVLNIYGNVDNGTNSDTRVSNASAESLQFLLKGRVKSYRTIMVHGKNAQHSALARSNKQVTKAMNNFLFNVNRAD